jgi:hypothetical protein
MVHESASAVSAALSLRLFRCGSARLRLMGDDLVFDLVVSCLRDNLLVHQIELGPIRPSVDNFLRVGVADAGQSLELIFGRAVEIELVGRGSGRRS